jgi:hypothetical protein
MLGEKVGEGTGKVTSQRVLPNPDGAPKMETTFQGAGTLLGIGDTETGTYVAVGRPDGSLFGEGQGIVMGRNGELATWTGQGVGRFQKDGTLSYRGAIYVQSASAKWAQLNGTALVYEYDVDPQGNTRGQLFEWK